MVSHDVIVAGGGPVGLTLAIDLGRRGVRTLLLERNATPTVWPKMDRTNARSMEMYRRIGLADRIRALGYPPDNPMHVFLLRRMSEPAIAVLPFPSVAEARERIAACTDSSLPREPYQLVSQNKIEPLLKQIAEATPNVTVRYGHEVIDVGQDGDGVTASVRTLDGEALSFQASYLVGCDGGRSAVRRALDIPLQGRGGLRDVRQVIFHAEDLYERIRAGKGRHYNFADDKGSVIIAQGDRKEFTLHTSLPADTDFRPVLRDLIGFDCDLDVRHVQSWRHNLLVAEHYGRGRVFLAGDAVHLVIPTGGLGMNSGVGDAFDLSWKLAGAVHGWGGPALLASYEAERRPVGLYNTDSAGWAAAGVPLWRALVTPEVDDDGPAGMAKRDELAAAFAEHHGRMHGMIGAEMNYTYAGSALIADEPDNEPVWERSRYVPHTRPGMRLPHMWLSDGRAMQDALGDGYTLLDLAGDIDAAPLERAFENLGAPLAVQRLNEPRIRKVYGRRLFLLRPDLHVAWRGDEPPADAEALARMATGHVAADADVLTGATGGDRCPRAAQPADET
ncbi:MAG: FAD-dependent monooxygenase [Alphaproteobacteria bacterium]